MLAAIALEAGQLILSDRNATGGVRRKDDGSPQSEADRRADALIRRRLETLAPAIPVVSEESGAPQAAAERIFLVDPLDGTREFLEGRDEFTVNIALIVAGRPEAGAVLAPALGEMFVAGASGAIVRRLRLGDLSATGEMRPLRCAPRSGPVRAVASRSHADPRTEALLSRLGVTQRMAFGSALKFCRVAEGRADLYPRLAPTMEWDTAAGEAVLAAAGGATLDLSGAPLCYGKDGCNPPFRNPPFIAAASRVLAEQAIFAAIS